MHFVKKVPTTEEELAAKKKKHEKQSKQFLHVRDRIIQKKNNDEYDDEMLSLTQQVLEKNADIHTFWNIRRTTIERRINLNKDIQNNSEIDAEEKIKSQKSIDNLLAGELFLSFECIKGNPKSYSSWFQRAWVLKRQQSPNFEKELALCDKALKMDCRNFHCWDHRRIVAQLARRTEQEEFDFSNKLIEDNFSNYSAWHYRSISLLKLHNEKTGQLQLDDTTISHELGKVKNAFYMDAEDQSAWTYTRWLLEVGSGKEIFHPESSYPICLISATFNVNNTTLVFSRSCTLDILLTFVNTEDRTRWKSFSSVSRNATSSKVWQYLSDTPLKVIGSQDNEKWIEIESQKYVNKEILNKLYDVTSIELPKSIERLLEDCKQLMDLEPKNKWPLYMRTLALMEFTPSQAFSEIITNLEKLADELDTNRKQFYKALASRQKINEALRKENTLEKLINRNLERLDLKNSELTTLDGIEYLSGFITTLDVSNNQIKDVDRIILPNLQNLSINENPIKKLTPSQSLTNLKFLSIASTKVSNIDDVMQFFQLTPSIEKFLFCETPLVEFKIDLSKLLPGVRLIPYWL